MKIEVVGCGGCPFLYTGSEVIERRCRAVDRSLPVNTRSPYGGEPTPDWCPARDGGVEVRLVHPPVAGPRAPGPRGRYAKRGSGESAARWRAENGGTFRAAGDKFGCKAQTVQTAWVKLKLQAAPRIEPRICDPVLADGSEVSLTRETLLAACVAARRVSDRQDVPDDTCRYCGKRWVRWAGSKLDGHVRCIVNEQFQDALLALYCSSSSLTPAELARLCNVPRGYVVAWLHAADRRDRERTGRRTPAIHAW